MRSDLFTSVLPVPSVVKFPTIHMTGLIVALLGAVIFTLGLPLFETLFGTLLLTVILAYPAGVCWGSLSAPVYVLIIAILLVGGTIVLPRDRRPVRERLTLEALFPALAWLGAFVVFYVFCLRWPDFVSMGERLRDYALLNSVLSSPLQAREPWMAGAPLNYYLYWYRFGHMLHSLGGLPVWEVYHQLQSFTLALLFSSCALIFSRYLNFRPLVALLAAALIVLGSNAAGVLFFLRDDHNWWGPSRVIAGAINEFPAWSFLLGDLHPHFLNLGLLPFVTVLVLGLQRGFTRRIESALLWVVLMGTTLIALYNANAWELPFGLLWGVCVSVAVWSASGRESARPSLKFIVWIGLGIAAIAALYLSSRNIQPLDTPLRLVTFPFANDFISTILINGAGLVRLKLEPPVAQAIGTPVRELFLHWGLPLSLIMFSLIALQARNPERVLVTVALSVGAASGSALVFLIILLAIIALRVWGIWSEGSAQEIGPWAVCEALGIAAILAVLVPEVIFFDDPYGGENERMNTIFKFYSASWVFLHLYAFYLFGSACTRLNVSRVNPRFRFGALGLGAMLMLGFFIMTVRDRETKEFSMRPYARGLSSVQNQFPGAGRAIEKLSELPRGTVLEAQGNPYSYTTFVSTLAGDEAYLGWANHVNLLLKNSPEVGRREQVTKDFYQGSDCAKRAATMKEEKIQYVVLGDLERSAYPGIDINGFGCLRTVVNEGNYQIFAAD